MATITPEQRSEILKVVVGLFNAAPGGIYMDDLAAAVEGGMSIPELADNTAANPIFTNGPLAGKVTVNDQVGLLMSNFGLMANNDPASAGFQAAEFFKSNLEAGVGFGAIVTAAAAYLSSDTVPAAFQTTKNLFLNKVAVAEDYSLQSNATDLNTLQNALSQVKGDHLYTAVEAQQIANNASATSFALTDGNDIVQGTAANDIIFGDPSSNPATMTAGDIIDGGSGYNILKVLGTLSGAGDLPGTITGVQEFQIAQMANADLNLEAYTKAATGLTRVVISDASLLDGKTITTTAGQSLSLATAGGLETAGLVTWAGSATDTSLNLTLNGYQGVTSVPESLEVTGAKATSLNIESAGTSNMVDDLILDTLIKTLTISGGQDFEVANDVTGTALETINAAAATGSVDISVTAAKNAAFAFTGGAGDDSLTFAAGRLGDLTSGSQLNGGEGNDALILSETAALTPAQIATINATQGFETLGFAASGSGADISTITNTGITGFKVVNGAATTFTNALNTSEFIIDNSAGAGTIAIGNKVGNDTTNVTIDSGAATTPQTVVALNFTGITKVNLTSSGSAGNTITTFGNVENSTITVDGNADLTFGLAVATTTGSKIDASALTGVLDVTGSAKNDIIIGGSGDDIINGDDGSDTLTGGAGNDEFDVSGVTLAANVFTTIADFTSGDSIFFTAATGTPTEINLASATSEADALNLLAAGGAGNSVTWGDYGGNTYVVNNAGAGATFDAAADQLVKLTGTVDLSAATITANELVLG